MDQLSRSRVDRAGRILRKFAAGEEFELNGEQIQEELDVLDAWRGRFRGPLQSTVMGLKSAVATTIPGSGVVRQRLKREEQILAKLQRSSTRLSQMEDIAGCRAIIEGTPDDLRRLVDRLQQRAIKLQVVHVDDYITTPRPGGYRALHVHGLRDDTAVEIQLRTQAQHEWAQLVEDWDEATGQDVKHEKAPEPVLGFFRARSEYLENYEMGLEKPLYVTMNLQRAAEDMLRFLREEVPRQ